MMASDADYISIGMNDSVTEDEANAYGSQNDEDLEGSDNIDIGDDEKHHSIELDMKPEDALPEENEENDDNEDDQHNREFRDNQGIENDSSENEKTDRGTSKEMPDSSAPSDKSIDEKYDSSSSKINSKDISNGLSRPPHGSEVFVGGITKDTTEEDLRKLCSTVGEVFEVRLLKDKETGVNKSFAFVTFTCKEHADTAIQTLTDSEVRGKKVRVTHSQSKHRLFIGNVPKSWSTEELTKALQSEGEGIVSVELLKDPKNPARNRGFAFVEYYNHTCAENARRNLSKFHFKLDGNVPTISWADPRPEPDSSAMSTVKVVYVKGLTESITEDKMRDMFIKYGEISKIVLPAAKPGEPKRDFGFVHFAERADALKAVDDPEKPEFDGKTLEVSLAKPSAEKRPPPEPYPRGMAHYNPRSGSYPYSQPHGNYGNLPLIYGRGPPPAGMTMVPMVLPDGRLGYVFQPPGSSSGGGSSGPSRSSRRSDRNTNQSYSTSQSTHSRRYRPY